MDKHIGCVEMYIQGLLGGGGSQFRLLNCTLIITSYMYHMYTPHYNTQVDHNYASYK